MFPNVENEPKTARDHDIGRIDPDTMRKARKAFAFGIPGGLGPPDFDLGAGTVSTAKINDDGTPGEFTEIGKVKEFKVRKPGPFDEEARPTSFLDWGLGR